MKAGKFVVGLLMVLTLALFAACSGKKVGSGASGSGDAAGQSGSGSDSAGGSGTGGTYGSSGSGIGSDGKLSTIYFEFDKAALSDDARNALKSNYQYANKNPKMTLVIEGHCDNRGTEEYNLALGERRAKAIRDYLVNLGLPSKRLSVISYGEEKPALTGDSEEAWAKNRRGEFVIGTK